MTSELSPTQKASSSSEIKRACPRVQIDIQSSPAETSLGVHNRKHASPSGCSEGRRDNSLAREELHKVKRLAITPEALTQGLVQIEAIPLARHASQVHVQQYEGRRRPPREKLKDAHLWRQPFDASGVLGLPIKLKCARACSSRAFLPHGEGPKKTN